MVAAYADGKFKAKLAGLGGESLTGSPAAFGKFLADEIDKWGKVIKFAHLKAA